MRRSIATVGAVLLGLGTLTPGAAPAAARQADPGPGAAQRAALSAGVPLADKAAAGARPAGANPYLALLSNPAKADYSGWSKYLEQQAVRKAKARTQTRAVTASPVLVDEDEPAGTRGSNDNPAAAQLVRGFGTDAQQNPRARVLGTLNPEAITITPLTGAAEDDGAIPLARDTGIGATRRGVNTSATIGDGPHGSAGTGTGDFDFYAVRATAGQTIVVDTDTPTGPLDTVVVLYDAAGNALATNDDDSGLDSKVLYTVDASATYYAMVTGYGAVPADPRDPASGSGVGSEGPYTVTITAAQQDRDFYAVKLRKGDVLGASVKGAATYLTVYDTDPREVHGSAQDASSVYPAATPLPGGGNAVTDHVATKAGWHYVGVTAPGGGAYDITVEGYRPVLEGTRPVQRLFLDFDGARLNTAIFGGPGVVQLSPMSAFLAKWGITRVDEDALIDAVVARVTENVEHDLIAAGLNEQFRIEVLNSRDHADPFGKANVSRVVVGGTVAESGVDTIGIAQSIDPGNFDTEESALVLLDYLSAPTGAASLNTYLTPASNRIGFVAQALGNIVAHEAGHFFGNWHVDQFNDRANLMDQGGNFPALYGVGADRIGGTADDPDVDFGHDTFNPGEGFTGTEDTLGRVLFGVTS